MNLLQIRTKFVQLSGRYDLVVDAAGGDYSDNGADFFINAGFGIFRMIWFSFNRASGPTTTSAASYGFRCSGRMMCMSHFLISALI